MGNDSEAFSNDIHWQFFAVSRDMMDMTQGNAYFPFAWRSSLASNYFLEKIATYLPEEYLNSPVGDIADIPANVQEALGRDMTVGQVLKMSLAALAEKTDVEIQEIVSLKKMLAKQRS